MTSHYKSNIYVKKYQPFIKWAGGKRNLFPELLEKFPKEFANYHEPFLGGGAVFFELYSKGLLNDKKIFLADINAELINAYHVVKNNPNQLISALNAYKKQHNQAFYYQTRALDRSESFKKLTTIQKAARFIYLNKTCFNGLYRVNKKGQFNTPMGRYKNPNIADITTILSASEALQKATISNQPFAEIISHTHQNDLIYLDPPYYPLNATSSFTAYNEDDFLDKQQQELFHLFEKLHRKKCFVVQSNSDTKFIHDLYIKYQQHKVLMANRHINSQVNKRQKITELLIRSFKDE